MPKFTLTEGVKRLFSLNSDGEAETSDLTTYERPLTLDISLAEGEKDGEKGLSIILTAEYPPVDDDEDGYLLFSDFMYPSTNETLSTLAERIVKALGINPEDRIWEDVDLPEA